MWNNIRCYFHNKKVIVCNPYTDKTGTAQNGKLDQGKYAAYMPYAFML